MQMVGAGSETAILKHTMAVIGSLHAFTCLLMLMAAQLSEQKNMGHRKCILGIYLISFLPCALATQFLYPAKEGAPPGLWTTYAPFGSNH